MRVRSSWHILYIDMDWYLFCHSGWTCHSCHGGWSYSLSMSANSACFPADQLLEHSYVQLVNLSVEDRTEFCLLTRNIWNIRQLVVFIIKFLVHNSQTWPAGEDPWDGAGELEKASSVGVVDDPGDGPEISWQAGPDCQEKWRLGDLDLQAVRGWDRHRGQGFHQARPEASPRRGNSW